MLTKEAIPSLFCVPFSPTLRLRVNEGHTWSARHICSRQNRCQLSQFLYGKWHSAAGPGSPVSSTYCWASSQDVLGSVGWCPQLLTAAVQCSDLLCTVSLWFSLNLPSSHSLYCHRPQEQEAYGGTPSPCPDKNNKNKLSGNKLIEKEMREGGIFPF